MAPKLTNEQREALDQHPGLPLEIEDEQTHRVYILVPKESFPQWVDEELLRQLQIGFDQADAGDVAEWDVDAVLEEAHRRNDTQAS